MTYPKYLYEIVAREFVAHADDGRSITLQQAHPRNPVANKDSMIYLSRADAEKLRHALGEWLDATP